MRRQMVTIMYNYNNGNRTEWSPIQSVNQMSEESDLFITSMITDGTGQQDALLPIYHNHNKNFTTKTKFH